MAMAARYGGGGGGGWFQSSGPIKHFLCCRWTIIVDNSTDMEVLTGRVEFFKPSQGYGHGRRFQSLLIQLEGTARIQFQTRIDNRVTNQSQEYKFLPPPPDPSDPNYPDNFETPYTFHFIRNGIPSDPRFEYLALGPGKHVFPFQIGLANVGNFPACLSSPYGYIEYKLAIYAGPFLCEDVIVNDIPIFRQGYFNFQFSSLFSEPLTRTSKTGTSFFSRSPKLQAKLTVNQKGYLPGETICFRLEVDNPNYNRILKSQVVLLYQTIYYAGTHGKQTTVVLDQKEVLYVDRTDTEIEWEELLQLPDQLVPSFKRKEKQSIECLYFVQFSVSVGGRPSLKGKAGIAVGTTRDGRLSGGTPQYDDTWMQREMQAEPVAGPSRRLSVNSHHSRQSSLLGYELNLRPPTYSIAGSMDTLPPSYEEAMENWDVYPESRPRCHSNIM